MAKKWGCHNPSTLASQHSWEKSICHLCIRRLTESSLIRLSSSWILFWLSLSETRTNNWVATPAKNRAVRGLKMNIFSAMLILHTEKIMRRKKERRDSGWEMAKKWGWHNPLLMIQLCESHLLQLRCTYNRMQWYFFYIRVNPMVNFAVRDRRMPPDMYWYWYTDTST